MMWSTTSFTRVVAVAVLVQSALLQRTANGFHAGTAPTRMAKQASFFRASEVLKRPRSDRLSLLSTVTPSDVAKSALVATEKGLLSDNAENMLNRNQQPPVESSSLSIAPQGTVDDEFTPFQMFARVAPFATLAAYTVTPEPFDHAVQQVWTALSNCPLVHIPLFEADVAVLGFVAPIAFYSILHLILGEQKTMENRLDGKMPHKPLEWAQPENWQLWFNPIAAYLGSIWAYHLIHEKASLPIEAPQFGIMCADLFFGVFLYDLLFYAIHYGYHHLPLGKLRRFHGYHHRMSSHSLNALETVQHSYADGFLQVAVNIFVQNISPFGVKHTLTRLLHNIVVTYLLAEAHSGYDLPWMTHRIWPEFLGGSPRHDAHHHDGRVSYHQYFKYFDDAFGFTKEAFAEKKKLRQDKSEADRVIDAAVVPE